MPQHGDADRQSASPRSRPLLFFGGGGGSWLSVSPLIGPPPAPKPRTALACAAGITSGSVNAPRPRIRPCLAKVADHVRRKIPEKGGDAGPGILPLHVPRFWSSQTGHRPEHLDTPPSLICLWSFWPCIIVPDARVNLGGLSGATTPSHPRPHDSCRGYQTYTD